MHDPRTCENSKPCYDCEYPLPEKLDSFYDAPFSLKCDILDSLEDDILGKYNNEKYWNNNIIVSMLKEHGYELK